jgi:Family of unknown function (DUF6348)
MDDINQSAVSEALSELLSRHGLDGAREQEWIVPNGQLPAIRALWHPRETSGRLNVQVLLEKGRVLEESFAGRGTGRSGFADAMNNFMLNSLHVLLAALWGIKDDEQVLIEKWEIGGKQFTAYIGNFGRRASEPIKVPVPKDLFETIQSLICHEFLPGGIHWFRFFFAAVAGQHTYEALKNNEPWETGLAGLKGIVWPETAGYYSVRNFIVLRSA